MVIPQGECFSKIKASFSQATIQAAEQLTAGRIAVSQGNDLPCKHVIHSYSSFCLGFGSRGEKVRNKEITIAITLTFVQFKSQTR